MLQHNCTEFNGTTEENAISEIKYLMQLIAFFALFY